MHTIYHYDPDTGAFVSEGSPRVDVLYPQALLMPAFSTTEPPPEHGVRQWPFWRNEQWCLLPDYRGVKVFCTRDGSQSSLDQPGITPDTVGLTETARPGPEYIWSNSAWVIDETYRATQRRAAAEREFEERLERAEKALNEARLTASLQEDRFLSHARQAAWTDYWHAIVASRSSERFPDASWPEAPTAESIVALADIQRKAFEDESAQREAEAAAEQQRREQEQKQWAERERQIREDESKRGEHPVS
ncbi:tail fiber assembly protein [Caballeronia sp. LZ001]|uniref:tail fiber assembly protein n=1 Tax=Caballeronia sp. LZ001 TaxID=3038553 RepID=UPI0028666721|nr:tail fiber assembly protein [Caballeronia sp. LZ001]MDR5803392.1 tail fiber assembly protein [Caballeronia sp. LZ001]